MEYIFYFILLMIVLGFASAGDKKIRENRREKTKTRAMAKVSDNLRGSGLSAGDILVDDKGNNGISVNKQNKEVCLIRQGRKTLISYRDILSSEILEDGETVTKTSRTSQIGGALIGGLAFGGVGAIIGGLSGSTTSSEKVSKIELVITVNDVSDPLHCITLMDLGYRVKKDNEDYMYKMGDAKRWHGVIQVLIRQADQEDGENERNAELENMPSFSSTSVADEVLKLDGLRKQGLLTEEEFATQKEKLLR